MSGKKPTQKVYERIAEQLKGQIESGKLSPGTMLPSERQLAIEFKASRTAIREAIHSLAGLGYLESKVGDGTFVREVSLDNILEPYSRVLSNDEKTIKDILDVRIILEVESTRLAALNATEEEIRRIDRLIDVMEDEVKSGTVNPETDLEIHFAIAEISGNEALAQILRMCSELLKKASMRSLLQPGRSVEAVEDHRKIAKAIENHEPKEALLAMKTHLSRGYQFVGKTNH